MIFHENRLLADDSHEISDLIFFKKCRKNCRLLSFAAVLIGALRVNAPIATKVVCFSRLLKYLRSLYGEQCGPRSDCSYRSSLFWVHAVCFYTLFVSNVRQLFAADNFSRRRFQMGFFLDPLRVNARGVGKAIFDTCPGTSKWP